jgi:hypothetical protein
MAMRVLKAHVKGGRLELDEPLDLPEGATPRVALIEEGEELPFEPSAVSIEDALLAPGTLKGTGFRERVEKARKTPWVGPRRPGTGRGLFTMGPDFDAPLPDFDEYMK